MSATPTLFSGIQPSGNLMIGNYIGALQHWVNLQQQYDCIFMIADLHTITVTQNPEAFRNRCYDVLALYIACGLDPQKNILFAQSHVPAHVQLAWILNCYTYMGELSRMTQFKDKSQKYAKNINVGLFDYPVLQAADILLYQTQVVPVGEDQKQHLELCRDLAIRFNNTFGELFTVPEPYIAKTGSRLMGLQEPLKKMSKSDENQNNFIALLDSPDVIVKKLKKAVTDNDTEIRLAKEKPGVSNLLILLSILTGEKITALEQQFVGKGYGAFKMAVAEALIALLQPIQGKFYALRRDVAHLDTILAQGAAAAQSRAQPTLQRVFDAVGLLPSKLP